MFENFYNDEALKYLENWGIEKEIEKYLSQTIDNKSKDDLIRIAILFHDLGKFTQRKINYKDDGSTFFIFKNHEIASANIIKSQSFSDWLKDQYFLTDAQINYIAQCAGVHYELGKIRDRANQSDIFQYVKGDQIQKDIQEIMEQNKGFELEIGILFLADSLAKTEIHINGNNDEDINQKSFLIKEEISKKGLNFTMEKAAKQMPINIKIAEIYLKTWLEKRSKPII